MRTLPFICMCTLCLASCSIKTDRTACPGLVSLTARGGAEDLMQVFAEGTSSCYEGQISKEGDAAGLSFEIERGPLLLSVVSGLHSCSLDGSRVMIPQGGQMDEIYAFSDLISLYSDIVEVSCVLHKQFALLYLSIIESETASYPFYVKVKGNVCGMDYTDMSPLPGPFSTTVHPVIGEYHRICLPRQTDDSLELEFYDKNMTKADDAPIDKLALGDYIKAAGYDWTREDLEDLYVNVDYTDAGVSVSIRGWEKIEL